MNNNDIVPGFDEEKDDSLKIRLQRVDSVEGCLVLYLTGYIDTYNSNFFQKRVPKNAPAWLQTTTVETVEFLDRLKRFGFDFATLGGISIGVEDPDDLIADFDQALSAI